MEIRKSTADDKQAITAIIDKCFGDRPHACEGIEDGRYLVGIINSTVVAMTGICPNGPESTNDYAEVDYTAVLPLYQYNGIMTELFGKMLEDAPDVLYYSAWRTQPSWDHAAAEKLLRHFGFKEIRRGHKHYCIGDNCILTRETCVQHIREYRCHCYEDLWVLHKS